MLPKVLAHQGYSKLFPFSPRHYFSILVTLFVLCADFGSVSAGQDFTNGISIINSPSAGSPGHAGSDLPISIDISGNGRLSPDAVNPSSTLPTHFDNLEIYVVSSETNLNFTVTAGPAFLTGEDGTVRHFSWPVPKCIPPGQYNVTFYETSTINGEGHFIISSIPIPIQNPNPDGTTCTEGVNALQAQPQPQNPLEAPFTGSNPTGSNPTPSGMTTSFTGSPQNTGLVTLTISATGLDFPTVTQTVSVTSPTTVVLVSIETVTTTATGQSGTVTSVFTQTSTTTAVMQPGDLSGLSGFTPVNAALRTMRSPILYYLPWILGLYTTLILR